MKKVKVVATVGPSLKGEERVERAILSGADVFRLNFSHGSEQDHRESARVIRDVARRLGQPVAILGDLQGPKIRIGTFASGSAQLRPGQRFELRESAEPGDETGVGLDYAPLLREAFVNDILVLDDGKMRLKVAQVLPDRLVTEALVAGRLSNNKGINRLGGGLSAPALTPKDFADIELAASLGVEYLAVSFPKDAGDMRQARERLIAAGSSAWLVAKIERKEAIDNLDEIIEASEGIMVARGDLALEVGDAAVPALQKLMIGKARARRKFSITATQMLESMIHASAPTRAEVSDIANAVLDGTDAVMLSAESATGGFAMEAIETMARVSDVAAVSQGADFKLAARDEFFERSDMAVAHAALFAAWHGKASAIVALTSTGVSALWISRAHLPMPILALTPTEEAARRMSILRGVQCACLPIEDGALFAQVWPRVQEELLRKEWVAPGEKVALTYGEPMGSIGGTDTMRMARVAG